jgi:hypothetical protein
MDCHDPIHFASAVKKTSRQLALQQLTSNHREMLLLPMNQLLMVIKLLEPLPTKTLARLLFPLMMTRKNVRLLKLWWYLTRWRIPMLPSLRLCFGSLTRSTLLLVV